ncbi:MAG: hypothetical protein QM601_12180 [Pseudoxanthomonas sp.]
MIRRTDMLTQQLQAVEDACRWQRYRQDCARILERHRDPAAVLAELFLFHAWLAVYAWRRCHRDGQAVGTADSAAMLEPYRRTLRHVEDVDVEAALGARIELLLETRFGLYDRLAALARKPDDPLGLEAAALVLACRLCDSPSARTVATLARKARKQYAATARACAAAERTGRVRT